MAVIEKVEQNVVDGNNVETTYYDNGDIRTVAKDSQNHEILNKLVNDEGDIRKSVERTYYDNGQQATEIEIYGVDYIDGVRGNIETTKWREDGQEIFYQKTDENNKVIAERVYDFFENGNIKKCEYKDEGEVTKIEEFYENSQLKRQQTGPKDAKEKNGVYYSIAEYTEKGQLLHSEGRGWTPGKDSLGWNLCSRYEKNIEYYDNGNIKSEKNYARIESVQGHLQSSRGFVKNYYENGNVKSTHKNSFEHLEPTDCDREYDEKGKLVHYIKRTRPGRSYVVTELTPVYVDEKIVSRKFTTPHDGVGEELYNNEGYLTEIVLKGDGKTTSIKFDGKTSFNINKPSDMSETPVYLSDNLAKKGRVSLKKVDAKGNIIDEEHYENGVLKSFKHHRTYNRAQYAWDHDYVTIKEEKDENGYSYFEKSKDGYEVKTRNAKGKTTYRAEGSKEGEISYMVEYDAAGEKLQRSIETLKDGKMKFTEYGEAETVETIKDAKGKVISETVITYHDDEHKKIATSKTTSPNNLAELTVAYNENGDEIFKQKVGAFGRLVELYEAYPNAHKKHHITTNADGSQEEKRWNEHGVETVYEKKDLKGNASNQTFYSSGRVQMESIDDGMIIYWDTEKNNVKERRDTKGDVIYKEYKNGQPKFEKHADGSSTEWYDSGEILCQADKKGNKVFFYKDGEERLTVKANGDKKVEYGDKQFLRISGRHCNRAGEGLSDLGEKQAACIGKFIAYASQGKIAGLPKIVLPEVCSFTENLRCVQTSRIIVQNINKMLNTDIKCDEVDGMSFYNKDTTCKHTAKSELSIHSLGGGYDTADSEMGSIAFSVVGRDGFVVDRVIFDAKQISEQIERIESKEKALEQQISNKIHELKSKTQTGNISDNPHAKTQVLRELAKDNLGKPKRSNADKQIIKSALDKVTKNTRS